MPATETSPENPTPVTAACRRVLSRLHNGNTLGEREIPWTARKKLLERRLIAEVFERRYQATPRAAGYCADPSTFEA